MAVLKTEYRSFAEIQERPQFYKDRILGIINFSESYADDLTENSAPTLQLTSPVLADAVNTHEVWLSETALKNGSKGAIKYRFNDEALFGVIQLQELPEQNSSIDNTDSLQRATELAYRQVLALIDELGYPHLYRFWNYMANINGISVNGNSGQLERYRHFNIGRKNILIDSRREAGKQLPAACALGLASGPLSIAFLVGKTAALAIENPRQVSAYEYPETYGPRTPSFSRATLLNTRQSVILFISGTASIVGHQTHHPLDVIKQTEETLANLQAVVTEANRVLGQPLLSLDQALFRVYIRNEADLPLIRTELKRRLGDTQALFVQADICRAELLLEIEATIQTFAKSV